MKIPFKTNSIIHKTPVDLIPEVGDRFLVFDIKETAVMAALETYNEADTAETYYTEDDGTKSIFCNPLVFGDKKFGFIGMKKIPTPPAAKESVFSRVFYLYEMK